MEPSMQIAVATGLGAAVGAVVGNLFVAFNGWRERIAQSRRAQREWAVNTAIAYWKGGVELANSERLKGHKLTIYPLHTYLFPMLAIADSMASEKFSEKNINALLARFDVAMDATQKHADGDTKGP